MLTPSQFKQKILNDVSFFVSFALENNANDIILKLNAMGYNEVNSEAAALNALNDLLKRRDYDSFIEAISVPLIPEKINPTYDQALAEAMQESYQRMIDNGLVVNRSTGGNTFGFNDFLAIVAGGLSGYLSSQSGVSGTTTGANASTAAELAILQQQAEAERRKRTTRTIIWVVVGITLVVVGFMLYKKYGK
jgi:hypothetical protein